MGRIIKFRFQFKTQLLEINDKNIDHLYHTNGLIKNHIYNIDYRNIFSSPRLDIKQLYGLCHISIDSYSLHNIWDII